MLRTGSESNETRSRPLEPRPTPAHSDVSEEQDGGSMNAGGSMKDELRAADIREVEAWVGWCCSYCAAPLEVRAHGLFCRAAGRFFATLEGVHRLLPEERRREVQPLVELQQRARRDAGWRAEPHAKVWRRRARMLRQGLAL